MLGAYIIRGDMHTISEEWVLIEDLKKTKAQGAAPSTYGEKERRVFLDPAYSGPERRLVGV